jgi:acyl carrier protein
MTTDEIKARLAAIFRTVFGDDKIEISELTTAEDIPQWDSITNINLVFAVEKGFQIRLTTREVRQFKNVGDLIKTIELKTPDK